MADTKSDYWRAVASEYLPMHSDLVRHTESHVDLWQQLKEIVADSNTDEVGLSKLRPIFDYAWWCIDESSDDNLVAAAETYFYEDLPAYSDTQNKIKHFIDQTRFDRLQKSLSARISKAEFDSIFADFKT